MAIAPDCATMHVAGATITSGAQLQAGKRAEISRFGPNDYVVQLVDFTWQDVGRPAGQHHVRWKWYRGETMVSTTSRYLTFDSTPYTLHTSRSASALGGAGDYKVETLVDDQLVATSHFTVGG